MKNFKGIADDIMKDITVTDALKEKTLARCNRKVSFNYSRYLVPAVCLLLIVSVVRFTGLFRDPLIAEHGDDARIMMATERAMESVTDLSSDSLDEVRNKFGQGYLQAAYTPEGFAAGEPLLEENDKNISVSVVYSKKGARFIIRQQKTDKQTRPEDSREISINGVQGYIASKAEEGLVEATELYWHKNGVQYSIRGSISDKEAVKIAESMK